MKRGRNWEAHAIIGGNGQGKSTFAKRDLFPAYDTSKEGGQKILILTSTDPPAYDKYRRINNLNDLMRWKHGIVKYYNHESPKQMLKDIHFMCVQGFLKFGAIFFEDCTNYVDDKPGESIKQFLVNRRMFELDMFFTTHALRFLPKFCRGMCNTVTVFKTAEVFEKPNEVRTLFYPNYEQLYLAWREVMATPHDKNNFVQHHLTVTTGL